MRLPVKRIIKTAVILMIAAASVSCSKAGAQKKAGLSGDSSAALIQAQKDLQPASVQKVPAFNGVDLNGNPVSDKLFSQKKITVVNVWGTFCPPCIGELPVLAEWARNMDEDAQLVGLLCDVSDKSDGTYNDALDILSRSGADYVNLMGTKEWNSLLSQVMFVPTTFFVDSTGKILGQITGAYPDRYKKNLEALLAEN